MNHIGLFEGIGGFSLASRWMGWNTIAWCEWNPFGQKILSHHFPYADGYGDITKTSFTKYANRVFILTGGFPCQPYSLAGKRKGKDDDRHLWPEMLRAIRETKPRWVVGENVPGLLNWNGGLVVDEIIAGLEAEGYQVFPPLVLPACAVNAPHRRDRVWIVAHAADQRCEGQGELSVGREAGFAEFGVLQRGTAHAHHEGIQGWAAPGYAEGGRTDGDQFAWGYDQPDDWRGFPTQSPVCSRNDGFPAGLDLEAISFGKWRQESVKAAGNAIVPQVALQIFRAIAAYESLHSEKL